ncbi:TPA: hypothetical protein NJ528_004504 [Vibrio parahaemolyticus]|nr:MULTISPECIES: hypothetical protein [Vibrio harveyi group]ARC91923.1 hypothetical protein B6A42_07225 [Vibrio coralliilyticus]HAS6327737.1 hypothetical protein [Vibrio vulnificus]MCG6332415.1 hypothetical protein [Vibrio alginolyticus]MCG6336745.1 hypothetical protein [Vibrio alginolyticus]MCG6396575.1 hypothetical protein [Vibrio alginolyticus]
MSKNLTIIGFVLTGSYIVGLALLLYGRFEQMSSMQLNEIGDFLAGIFGPVAFLWLVLGFLQQGKELQQSTKALELQAAELNQSVEQQRELVEVTRAQLEAERLAIELENERRAHAAKPDFLIISRGASHSGGKSNYSFGIKNTGSTATRLRTEFGENMPEQSTPSFHVLEKNQEVQMNLRFSGAIPDESLLKITYIDMLGKEGQSNFKIIKQVDESSRYPSIGIAPIYS